MVQGEGTNPQAGKVTVDEFAAKIKEKYPEYKDVDNLKLAQSIVEKYPEYKEAVVFETTEPVKKKDGSTPLPSSVGQSPSQEYEPPTEQDFFKGSFGDILKRFDEIVPLGFGDFIDDMGRAAAQGYFQGVAAENASDLLLRGSSSSDEDIYSFLESSKNQQMLGPSQEMLDYQKIYEENGKGFMGVVLGLAKNPSVVPELVTSSLVAMASDTDAVGTFSATVGTGTSIGAGVGGAAGMGVGALPGAVAGAAASVPYAFAAAGSALEMGATFAELLQEEAGEDKELTPYLVRQILNNEESYKRIRNKAVARGLVIGAIDAYTGKLGGKVASNVLTKGGTQTVKQASRKQVLGSIATATGIEAVGGSAGEAAARAAIGQELDVSEIALEGISEAPGGVRNLVAKRFSPAKYMVNGEKVTAEVMDDLIETMTLPELLEAKISIENDYEGRSQKLEDKKEYLATKQLVKKASPDLSEQQLDEVTELQLELNRLEGNKTQPAKQKASDLRKRINEVVSTEPSEKEDGSDLYSNLLTPDEGTDIYGAFSEEDASSVREIDDSIKDLYQKIGLTENPEEKEQYKKEILDARKRKSEIEAKYINQDKPSSGQVDTAPENPARQMKVDLAVQERAKPEYVERKVSQLPVEDTGKLSQELEGEFGLLTAENPMRQTLTEEENAELNKKAEAWLKKRNYTPRRVSGKYGQAENSFFVPGLTKEDAIEFAKEFNQESVAHSEGLIYQDGSVNPRDKSKDDFSLKGFDNKSDEVSVVNTAEGPKTFKVGYDFATKVEQAPAKPAAVEAAPSPTKPAPKKPATKQKTETVLAKSDVSSRKFGSSFNTLKDNFQKLLSKLGGENIPVYVVSDEVYKSVTGKTGRGTFTKVDGKDVILVNADKATLGTVYHEMMHAYVATMNLSPRQIVDFVNTIRAELAKGNASERALAKRLTKFQTEYIKQEVYGKGLKLDDPIIAEEFLSEFVAQLKDGIDVGNISVSTIENIRLAIARFINKVFNASIDTSPIENRQEAFDFVNGFLDALEGRVTVEPSINKTANPNQAQRSRLQIEAPAGSKLFNTPLEDATTLARQYMDSKGLEYKEGSSFNKVDEERAKRISDAYTAMKDEPTNPAVAAAYNAMAEETLEQYELISKAGYTVEMSDKEYDNSAQMIADLRDNKRMRIFSTEAGFGDDPITAKQRSENPLLQTTKYKDVNGEPLLVNDVFRFVHDFFGHAKRGNSFGPKGEENAWDVHSRMYTPLARRAMTSETRGQNSYVNFSGVNAEAFKLRDKARELRKEGKFAEAKELTNQVYGMMKFADQKVGLLPDEFVENPYDNAPSLLEEEEQGDAGEVGTINIPRQQIEVIDAPKLSEDNRSFVQKFVTDIKMAALQGRRFVTNMYDYTNAGVTNLGNGYSIELFGGRNYVPMMMERNGVELGDVSNLAAFNSKEQAEGFIRNATKGKADLFGPHSGGLEGSWQFQHHIFESLVNLVLDNKILSKSELIELFNTGLNTKGPAGGIKAFAKFNERNKSKLRNLSRFKKNPLELVELLNAENNYSPNLRKILNQKIASNKKFQKAIGVKNLNEFHNRISDPLNIGVSGGEIMTFVEFDPSTFKIVKTKPGDVNHHPSFGWVVMAKIKAIHHPDKYYKSYDITDSYTKHNVDGTVVEKKSEVTEKEFIESNVKSSAGAIAKVAEVDIPRQQIDWQPNLLGKGKANPAIVNRTTPVQEAAIELLQGKITNAEYQEVVRTTQTIEPITRFFLPASTKDMQGALDSNKAKLLNTPLEDGAAVGLRLDIPAYKNWDIWIVSIHDSGKAGKSLSYGSVAWATDVTFGSNPKVAAFIAAGQNLDLSGRLIVKPKQADGKTTYDIVDTTSNKVIDNKATIDSAYKFINSRQRQDKTTIARMHGKWKNFEGKTKEDRDASAVKKVEEIVSIENSFPGAGRKGSPWRQVGMNPFRHSFFYDRRTGQPVIAASEVVQIGGLVYAKDVVYADKNDPIFNVEGYKDANGDTVRFQIEDQVNEEANNKQTYDAVENNSQGLFDADVDAAVDADVSEMDSWKERPRTMFERFIDLTRLKIQDKFRKIIAVQEDIEFSKGSAVDLDEDFRNAEALMHGKAKEELNKTERIVAKIANLIKASGLSLEQFNDLLYAMHAQERNRYLRVISTDIGKSLMAMRKKKGMKPSEVAELLGISTQDYIDIEANKIALKTSDLTDVLLIYGTTPSRFFYDNAKVKDGSGMTDVEARKILAKYGLDLASPDVSQLKPRIAIAVQAVRDLTADTRNRLLESGLETQATIDAFEATYKNYVPLRGFADGDLQSEILEGGRRLEVRGREKRAKGRTTKADSPLTQVIISNTTTIVRAEKNGVMNRFYKLAVNNPNKDVYEVVDPKVTKEYKREIRNGKIITTAKTIADYMADPNMVSVRVGGEYKFIRFKDASLADALRGANVVKADWMVKYLGAFNRALSSFITTYDPEFVLRNFSRDIQTAVLNLFAEQEMSEGLIKNKNIVANVIKDVLPAIKSIAIVEGGKSSKNKEMDQYYKEFKEDGARTEWFYSKSSTEVEKDIKNLIEGKGETALQAAGNLVERINSAVENGVRLSAYVNARKAGISRAKAAELAKNLTVNFNKSGEWGQIGNTLFLFFNASVQGTSRLMRSLKPQYKVDSEGNRSLQLTTAQRMAIGLSLMGSIMSLLNEAVSDDDEDDKSFYSKIPDFEKERNIIIMKPNGKGYWKIPLPYGVNVFYVTGTLLADASQKIKSPGEVAGGIMQAAIGSFSPINFPNSDDTAKFLVKFVTPTIGQVPLALAINENYFGQTIYNKNFPFDTSPKPESELGRKGGNRWTKELTRLLNKISGGSEFRGGEIDINPDKIDFVMESYSGGMGKFVSRSANTIDKIITGNWDQIEPRQVPFLRVFYGQSSKYADLQEFYSRSVLVNQMQEEVKAGIISGAEAKRVSKVFYLGKNIRKQLSNLKKREDAVMQIKDADVQREKMKKLEELRYKLVADYNKQYERFEIDKLK